MRDVFFIQRAAIDVLLLNQATAIEICTYLVISKYADMNGYYSGVGYKTIRERLGINQKKAVEAIKRLTAMKTDNQRLLYTFDEWMFQETGVFQESIRASWVRGCINSGYNHQVWLSNDLIGNNGDHIKPLNYFARHSAYDNHARMLLLLYKYNHKDYAGVNYKLASIGTQIESTHQINGYEFHKSQLGNYHISSNIFSSIGINLTDSETTAILDDLRDSQFINISVSAIGNYQEQEKPVRSIKKSFKFENTRSSKQIEAYEQFKLREEARKDKTEEKQINYILFKKSYPDGRFSIRRKRIPATATQPEIAPVVNYGFDSSPIGTTNTIDISPPEPPPSKLVYQLDCKSANKRALKLDSNLATTIEGLAARRGLESASRKGKFYKSYWWFDPGLSDIQLVGILTPSYVPAETHSLEYDQIRSIISEMISGKEGQIVQQEEFETNYTAPDVDF